jgi:hypothetical protein
MGGKQSADSIPYHSYLPYFYTSPSEELKAQSVVLLKYRPCTVRSRKPRIRPRDPLRWPRGTLFPQKLALTSPISGGRSVGIVRSRTQATEFVCLFCL